MSGSGLHDDEALRRLVAWGRALAPRRVLDVTGGGHAALVVAAAAPHVTALDALATVAASRALAGAARNVRFVAGDTEALPFDDGVFDLVSCHLTAHRFSHAALAVREIQRVLAAGGSFLLAERPAHDEGPAGAGALSAHATSPTGSYRRREWQAFLRAAGLTTMEEDVIASGTGAPADRIVLLRAEKD